MSKSLVNTLIFLAGALVGSTIGWIYNKNKYKRIAEEEIDSVKEHFCVRKDSEDSTQDDKSVPTNKNGGSQYSSIVNNYSSGSCDNGCSIDDSSELPYIISSDDFGEIDDYDRVCLTYFSDNVLVDEINNITIDDSLEAVGSDALKKFEECKEDDAVYVRNDKLKIDYEILLDGRRFSDIQHPTED